MVEVGTGGVGGGVGLPAQVCTSDEVSLQVINIPPHPPGAALHRAHQGELRPLQRSCMVTALPVPMITLN